jgi:hypothetical protein
MQAHRPLEGRQNQLVGIELDRERRNPVAWVCEVVSELFSRHETLRTTYQLRPDNQLQQLVRGRADLVPEIETVTSWLAWEDIWNTMRHSYRRRFELSTDLPARVTLFVLDGQVTWLLLTISHMAVDVTSVRLIDAELRRALAGTGVLPEQIMQPLEWASWERSERGQAQNARAVQYWQDTLARFTALPGDGARPGCSPRYRRGNALLPRMFRAADVVATEVGVTLPSVLIAALAWTLSRSLGAQLLPVSIRTGNRTQRALREAVGHYAQTVPVVLEAPEAQFLSYAQEVHWKLVHAYRYGAYNPLDVEGFLLETGERLGQQHPLRVILNYWPGELERSGDQPEPVGRLTWEDGGVDKEFVGVLLHLSPSQTLIKVLLDTTFLDPDGLRQWLLASEELLHGAAEALPSRSTGAGAAAEGCRQSSQLRGTFSSRVAAGSGDRPNPIG